MCFDTIIYEEEIDVLESEIALEKALNKSYYLIYLESSNTESNKSNINKIIDSVKAFINKCLEYIKNAIKKIKERIQIAYNTHKIKSAINDFEKKLATAENCGVKSFQCIDFEKLYDIVHSECNYFRTTIESFRKSYLKKASPKDAERFLTKFKKAMDDYDTKVKNILDTPKEFSIKDAKRVIKYLDTYKDEYINILNTHYKICEESGAIIESTLSSLDKYSDETGYIQNARTLQQILHNSCVRLQVHSAECISNMLKYGIPLISTINKVYDSRNEYSDNDKHSTRSKIIETVGGISGIAGGVSGLAIKSVRKVTRRDDIEKWSHSGGNPALSFDTRKATRSEKGEAAVDTAVDAAIKAAKKIVKSDPKK